MTPTAALLAAVAASTLAATAAAQEPTARDFSSFTRLREGGYPAKTASSVMGAEEAPIEPGDLVIGVELAGAARAYPLGFLWGPKNEIVNDTLGGAPIAASWCPLSHSGAVYRRSLGGRVLSLGARGAENGALLLYDAQTQSTWSQLAGRAVSGTLSGEQLEPVPSVVTTWALWRAKHPASTVYFDPLEPYSPRYTAESFAAMAAEPAGPPRASDWVVGIDGAQGARAYPVRRFAQARVVNDDAPGGPLAVVLHPDRATLRVFRREARGRVLTLRWEEGRLVDAETGTRWDPLEGAGLTGPLAHVRLAAVPFTSALFYAWKAYRPATGVWEAPAR